MFRKDLLVGFGMCLPTATFLLFDLHGTFDALEPEVHLKLRVIYWCFFAATLAIARFAARPTLDRPWGKSEFESWNAIRQKGRKRFIWTQGVISWGGTFTVVFTFLMYAIEGGNFA